MDKLNFVPCTQMNPLIGQRGTYDANGFELRVTICDAGSDGPDQIYFQIESPYAAGKKWVPSQLVKLDKKENAA